ncbi:MAG TPA: DUF5132 domain-containing protein [Isosphaeraceae bacterium]|nr:DUF5132 domain-containing protein [Isosphaeraceae bacterium]
MALLEDVLENSFPGVLIGAVATAVLLPLVTGRRLAAGAAAGAAGASGVSVGRGVVKPLMKAAVRGYLAVSDTVKEVASETREQMSDLVAEVREERRMSAEAPEPPANPPTT